MDKKTGGILATLVSVLLCGCPGMFACLFGAITALGGGTYTTELGLDRMTGTISPTVGYATLCAGLILMLIPVVVAILTLRRKGTSTAAAVDVVPPPG